jgi:Fibronectin type III domain
MMKKISSLIVVLRVSLIASVLAACLVILVPSAEGRATCTNGLNAAYTEGDYLYLNRYNRTSVFQISTGSWMKQVDLDSPAYWNQPNAPFHGGYRGKESNVDAMYYWQGVVHVIRGTTAYRYDGTSWWTPVDLNTEVYWRVPGAPFEGGDTRPIDAAFVYDNAIYFFRDTKVYIADYTTSEYYWQTPRDLTAPQQRWTEPNAPFESSTTPIDDAYIQDTYMVIQRDRVAYLWQWGNWLTPVHLDSPAYWSQPNAPFFDGFAPARLIVCSIPPPGPTPTPPAPSAPTMLQVTSTTADTASLSWQDNSTTETGFVIFRDGSVVKNVAAGVTTAKVTGLTPDSKYCFRVKSFTGATSSLPSNEACTTTLSGIPAAPTMLQMTATTANSISLSWKDNSTNETGFRIVRDGTSAISVGANVTTATIKDLTSGWQYCFKVTAVTANKSSLASNELCTTTSSGSTGSIDVNLVSPNDLLECGSATIQVAGRKNVVPGVWTGDRVHFKGNCIYATTFTGIPASRQIVTAPDFYACGIAYVDPKLTLPLKLVWGSAVDKPCN